MIKVLLAVPPSNAHRSSEAPYPPYWQPHFARVMVRSALEQAIHVLIRERLFLADLLPNLTEGRLPELAANPISPYLVGMVGDAPPGT